MSIWSWLRAHSQGPSFIWIPSPAFERSVSGYIAARQRNRTIIRLGNRELEL